jgi:hypothetical protein
MRTNQVRQTIIDKKRSGKCWTGRGVVPGISPHSTKLKRCCCCSSSSFSYCSYVLLPFASLTLSKYVFFYF